MIDRWMISSDSHIVEPPDLFTTRIDRAFVDDAPRVIETDGVDWWTFGAGAEVPAVNPTRAGDRFQPEEKRRRRVKFSADARLGGFMPDEWVKDNETDGVWGGVLFPSMSLVFYGIENSALLSAVCRVFTDWCIEFASAYPHRLKAVAMINLDDVDAAVTELQRARSAGAAGALIPVAQPAGRTYDQPMYEQFWAAAADLAMPVNMHTATNRTPNEWKLAYKLSENAAAPDYWVRVALGDLIFSGVFARHPSLRVGSVEHEAGWAAHWLARLDHQYTESIDYAQVGMRFPDGRLPSDYFRENCFISFCEDAVAIRNRDLIGVGNLMWGNDYPHGESTFPQSREIVGRHLEDVSEQEQFQLTAANTAELYGFDVPAGSSRD